MFSIFNSEMLFKIVPWDQGRFMTAMGPVGKIIKVFQEPKFVENVQINYFDFAKIRKLPWCEVTMLLWLSAESSHCLKMTGQDEDEDEEAHIMGIRHF